MSEGAPIGMIGLRGWGNQLRAGKHIFVEKPVTNTVAEARQALEAVNSSGIICMVGHNDRMHPVRRRMKELIDSGRLGRVFAVEGNQSHRGGLRPPDPRRTWRRSPDLCPAVPLMQLGVHLLGRRALRVTAVHRSLLMGDGQTDVTSQILEYPEDVLFTLNSYYITPGTLILNVYGTEANLYSHDGPGGRCLRVRTADGEEVETAHWGGFVDGTSGSAPSACAPTTAEMRQFGECLLTGRRPEVTIEVALEALAAVEASIVSSREGRAVALSELL